MNLNANSQSFGPRGLINYPNFYFVEAGTAQGNGVQEAVNSEVFYSIYSMDIDTKYVHSATERFIENVNVSIFKGDSAVDFTSMISNVNLPATFWLDACMSLPGSKRWYNEGWQASINPILDMLDQINAHPINTHTIMINNINWLVNTFSAYFSITDIIAKLEAINPNYIIEYVDGGDSEPRSNNVLVAHL